MCRSSISFAGAAALHLNRSSEREPPTLASDSRRSVATSLNSEPIARLRLVDDSSSGPVGWRWHRRSPWSQYGFGEPASAANELGRVPTAALTSGNANED